MSVRNSRSRVSSNSAQQSQLQRNMLAEVARASLARDGGRSSSSSSRGGRLAQNNDTKVDSSDAARDLRAEARRLANEDKQAREAIAAENRRIANQEQQTRDAVAANRSRRLQQESSQGGQQRMVRGQSQGFESQESQRQSQGRVGRGGSADSDDGNARSSSSQQRPSTRSNAQGLVSGIPNYPEPNRRARVNNVTAAREEEEEVLRNRRIAAMMAAVEAKVNAEGDEGQESEGEENEGDEVEDSETTASDEEKKEEVADDDGTDDDDEGALQPAEDDDGDGDFKVNNNENDEDSEEDESTEDDDVRRVAAGVSELRVDRDATARRAREQTRRDTKRAEQQRSRWEQMYIDADAANSKFPPLLPKARVFALLEIVVFQLGYMDEYPHGIKIHKQFTAQFNARLREWLHMVMANVKFASAYCSKKTLSRTIIENAIELTSPNITDNVEDSVESLIDGDNSLLVMRARLRNEMLGVMIGKQNRISKDGLELLRYCMFYVAYQTLGKLAEMQQDAGKIIFRVCPTFAASAAATKDMKASVDMYGAESKYDRAEDYDNMMQTLPTSNGREFSDNEGSINSASDDDDLLDSETEHQRGGAAVFLHDHQSGYGEGGDGY